MKHIPIPFAGPMVRGVLSGRKTKTRRVVKRQAKTGNFWKQYATPGEWLETLPGGGIACTVPIRCPYGQPGDRLWVREAWRTEEGGLVDFFSGSDLDHSTPLIYEADGDWSDNQSVGRYRHARFMPRWASRILLEVVSVRLERLQDITEADAIAEGATCRPNTFGFKERLPGWSMEWPDVPADELWRHSLGDARMAFANYICRLHDGPKWNLKPRTIWTDNPWVWVVEFRRVEA